MIYGGENNMLLSLLEFDKLFDWNDAEITYLQLVSNSVHMDVSFVTFKQRNRNTTMYKMHSWGKLLYTAGSSFGYFVMT